MSTPPVPPVPASTGQLGTPGATIPIAPPPRAIDISGFLRVYSAWLQLGEVTSFPPRVPGSVCATQNIQAVL